MSSKQTILVTGATGYLASHIISLLLEQGKYNIRGTVRSVAATQRYQHLIELAKGKESTLEFVEGDLTNEEHWPKAVNGTIAVLHVASPYFYVAKDPQKEIVDPAVNGSLNVLRAAAASETCKRVIITSSGGAIFTPFNTNKGHVYTEQDWNNAASLETSPYFYSKVMTERAAWKFAEEHKGQVQVTVLNPVFILGPALNPWTKEELSTSLKGLLANVDKIKTEKGVPAIPTPAIIDVRDAARAHVLALEAPDVAGKRILVASGAGTWYDIFVDIAKKIYATTSNPSYEKLKAIIPEPSEIKPLGNPEEARLGVMQFSTKTLYDTMPSIGKLYSKEDAVLDCLAYLADRNIL